MSYKVRVYLKSASFSEEYALEKHQGNDSPENIRYEWEDEFKITSKIEVIECLVDDPYVLAGEIAGKGAFSFAIEDMYQFVFHAKNSSTTLAFSKKCLDEYFFDHDTHTFTVYLNDNDVVENPIPGIYIVGSDFPKELKGSA
ncbi:MAG TPA: hypothetical protein PLI97_01115 [Fluviicola sp.]|nr:hypothetical protein [Fluviicola sp.]